MSEQIHVEVFGDDEKMTFNVAAPEPGQPVELHVQTTSGEIFAQATDRQDIQVWLEITGRSAHQPVVTATWDGRRLDISPAKSFGAGRVFRNSPGFDVRVEIPERLVSVDRDGVTARLLSASGEITAGRLSGDIRVTTASGDLTLDHLTGRIDCKSASGDIVLGSPRGQLRVATASGDVTLVEAILARWELNTVSGSVDGSTVLAGTGPYRLNTVSGDAELRLGMLSGPGRPEAFTIESSSMSGDLEVEGAARKLGRRRWHIGAGSEPAATIRLTSVSGDISIMADSAAFDGDVDLSTGPWAGGDWEHDHPDDDTGLRRDEDLGDLANRITSSVDSAMGKVDWRGIDRTVDRALASAFGARRPPTAPVTPASPVGPSPIATPFDELASVPDETKPAAVKPDKADAPQSDEERRLDILRRIERGELSVEEGMAQLDGPAQPRP